MRIEGFEIRAFGPLAGLARSDLARHDVVCILGANESGKTSLCEFAWAALFGFPERSLGALAPWSGLAAEGALDLVLERAAPGRREARVWRRSPDGLGPGARGTWMTVEREAELANAPVPPLAGRARELVQSLASLSAAALANPTELEWAAFEERVQSGGQAGVLRSARTAAGELARAADRLWRPDRRGRPRARVLLEERDLLRRARREARERAALLRELESQEAELGRRLAQGRFELERETARAQAAERDRALLAGVEREARELAPVLERERRRLFGELGWPRVVRALARLDPAPLAVLFARCRGAQEAALEARAELERLERAEAAEREESELERRALERRAGLARRRALAAGLFGALCAALALAGLVPGPFGAAAAIAFAGGALALLARPTDERATQDEPAGRAALLAERRGRAQLELARARCELAALEIERAGWLARVPLRRELAEQADPELARQLDELAEKLGRAGRLRRERRRLAARARAERPARRGDLEDELAAARAERARVQARQSELAGEATPDDVDGALAALEDELAAVRDRRDELALASALVLRAVETWRERHQPELFARASGYLAAFTGGRWRALAARESAGRLELIVRAEPRAAGHPVAAPLSRGLRSQVQLALRLALLEELEAADPTGEPMPLWLDEAFAEWDPARAGQALALLGALSRKRQVFALTAQPDFAHELEHALGAHVVEL